MGYDGILSSLLQMKHIYSLIDNKEMKGWTAAHLAALRNRAGCLAVLIGRAADVYTVTDKVMYAMNVAEKMITKNHNFMLSSTEIHPCCYLLIILPLLNIIS